MRFVLLAGYALTKKKARKARGKARKKAKRNGVCRDTKKVRKARKGGGGGSNYDKGAKFCPHASPR